MLKVTWRVLAQLLMHHFNGHFSKQRERLLWEHCTVLLKKREVAGSKCVRTWGEVVLELWWKKQKKKRISKWKLRLTYCDLWALSLVLTVFPGPAFLPFLSECTLYKSLAHKQTYMHSSDICSFWPPWTLPQIICHRTNNNFHIQHHVVDHNSTLSRVVAKTCFVLYLLCTNSTIKGISLGCPIWVYAHKVPVLMLKRNSWYAPALWLCWDFFGTVTHLPNKDKRLYSVGQPRHRDSLDFLFIAASDKRSYGFKRK